MPGTIQVTVLEFKGVSSSSQPSAKFLIQVSMGKRCYQTWDKGDFSFPISKLREDLVVTLLDAAGNDLAHAAIRTMQIIEKGYWDEVFALDGKGGRGHVHMKLQFILSEEERKRIRVMRESAIKKKQEAAATVNTGISDSTNSVDTSRHVEQKVSDSQQRFVQIDLVSPKVEASEPSALVNSAFASSVDSLHNYPKDERQRIIGSAIPVKESSVNATDKHQSGSSSPPVKYGESSQFYKKVPAEKIETRLAFVNTRSDIDEQASKSQDGPPILESRKQGQAEKTPSNVRKMISAFENSRPQGMVKLDFKKEVKSLKKASSVPSQLNRIGKKGIVEAWEPNIDKKPSDKNPRENKNRFIVENLRQTTGSFSGRTDLAPNRIELSPSPKELDSSGITSTLSRGKALEALREKTVKEREISSPDLIRQSTSSTATSSGKMHEEQSRVVEAHQISFKKIDSSDSSVTEGRERGPESDLKSSAAIAKMDLKQKRKSLEYYKEEYYSSESSGMWIFPDNTRRLCITTAGKRVMRSAGYQHGGSKSSLREKRISSEAQLVEKADIMHGGKYKTGKDPANFNKPPESASGSSPDDSSNGLIGQVIKIVVILGFGVLVLLTRQKEPRKNKNREENVSLFTNPDFIDGRTLTL